MGFAMSFVSKIFQRISGDRRRSGYIAPYPAIRFQPINNYMGNDTVLSQLWYGDGIFLDACDLQISASIIRNGIWEPSLTRFIIDNLREGDVFVDVGANVGYFSLLASRTVQADGFVVAFEPQPKLAEFVRHSLEMNAYRPISCVRSIAIGEREEMGVLGHVANSSGASSLAQGFGDGSRPASHVAVVPLDIALAEVRAATGRGIVPSMIKIDVEGFEYSVWRGMQKTIASTADLIVIMEFSPSRYVAAGQDPAQFIQEIISCGFSIVNLGRDGKESPFNVDAIPEIIASNDFVDLVLRKGRRFHRA